MTHQNQVIAANRISGPQSKLSVIRCSISSPCLPIIETRTSKANSSTFSPLWERERERERDCWSQGDYYLYLIFVQYQNLWLLGAFLYPFFAFVWLQPPLSIEFRSNSELVSFNIEFSSFLAEIPQYPLRVFEFSMYFMIILCIFVYTLQYPIHFLGNFISFLVLYLFIYFCSVSEMSCLWFLSLL